MMDDAIGVKARFKAVRKTTGLKRGRKWLRAISVSSSGRDTIRAIVSSMCRVVRCNDAMGGSSGKEKARCSGLFIETSI